MIISLDTAKKYLKIELNFFDDDIFIQVLINAAEEYLKNATGKSFDESNELAKLFCLVLISDWYVNREYIGKASEKVRISISSILTQLQYCYDEEVNT